MESQTTTKQGILKFIKKHKQNLEKCLQHFVLKIFLKIVSKRYLKSKLKLNFKNQFSCILWNVHIKHISHEIISEIEI